MKRGIRMKISILEKSDKEVYIEMDVTDMTLLHPLVEELVKDKNVDIAEYKIGHPELDKPVLHVRMKSGKPETAIKKATKTIVENFSDLKAGFEKEL
jgi:DNA-directed RNA polymerase subunit L